MASSNSTTSRWSENGQWRVPFFTIWTGQAFSLLGSRLVQFALVWWLTRETNSATVLATATLIAMLPYVLLGPIIGALVDRWNRRRIMIVADSGIALATIMLALLFVADMVQVWHIYVILVIRALGGIFHWTSMQASTTLMVPKEQLSRVAGMNQTLRGGVDIIGPPLGALLMEALPMQAVLAVDVGTAALAVLPLLFIQIPQPQAANGQDASGAPVSVWQDFRTGLRYVLGWPGLVAICLMATLINFLYTPAGALTPLLVRQHFDGGAVQLSWLDSAWGAGLLLGGLTLSVWGGFKRGVLTSMTGLLGMGSATLLIGFAPSGLIGMAVAGMFFAGFMNPIVNGPLQAVVQKSVAPEMQGRVFTLISSLAMGMSLFSLMIAGPVADVIGIQTWYILAALGTIAAGVIGLGSPVIMQVEEQVPARQVESEASGPESASGVLTLDTTLDR